MKAAQRINFQYFFCLMIYVAEINLWLPVFSTSMSQSPSKLTLPVTIDHQIYHSGTEAAKSRKHVIHYYLLMLWSIASPGYQQSWHRRCKIMGPLLFIRNGFNSRWYSVGDKSINANVTLFFAKQGPNVYCWLSSPTSFPLKLSSQCGCNDAASCNIIFKSIQEGHTVATRYRMYTLCVRNRILGNMTVWYLRVKYVYIRYIQSICCCDVQWKGYL